MCFFVWSMAGILHAAMCCKKGTLLFFWYNNDGDLVTSPGHGMWAHASVNTAQHSVAQRQPSLNVFFQALSYPTASSATVQVCFGSHPIVHHPGQLAGLQRSLKVWVPPARKWELCNRTRQVLQPPLLPAIPKSQHEQPLVWERFRDLTDLHAIELYDHSPQI